MERLALFRVEVVRRLGIIEQSRSPDASRSGPLPEFTAWQDLLKDAHGHGALGFEQFTALTRAIQEWDRRSDSAQQSVRILLDDLGQIKRTTGFPTAA